MHALIGKRKIMNQTNAKENIAAMNHSAILSMVITAICITLTYIFTAFINIRLPIAANGGLVHLGNVALFISAILFGKKTGALAGGIGMGLFDLLSGWTAWAPFTLIIVGIMGFIMGWMTEHKKTYPRIILAMIMVSAIKIVGYYLAEVILYGNWVAPITSVPGNLVQMGVGSVIVLVVIGPILKIARREGI